MIGFQNMRLFLFFVFCAVGLLAKCVLADEVNEVKRGVFPFMAFVYYPDTTIVDRTGARLSRGAILIRPEWLISSSLEDGQTSLEFPKETLLARLGAVRIDSKFSVNEDEDEQEREVIQIARPYNYSAMEWWVGDISLLKTLSPFNITPVVAPVAIRAKPRTADNGCFILIYYSPNGNLSEDKILMQVSVEMLASTPELCGSNYVKRNMICATDSDNLKKKSNFCEGNSGSPLICENDVIGIQTYINDCKPPHLYQHLGSWNNLITCAVEDKCQEEQCATICKVIYKDPVDIATPRTLLSEAKTYPEENLNHSTNEIILSTTLMRRLLPDNSKTISDNDSDNEVNNTETTTSTSSIVAFTAEKEIVSSETEMVTPTGTGHTEEEQETNASSDSTTSVSYNTKIDTTQYIYKTEELVSKIEELKNVKEENGNSDTAQIKEQPHKVRSAASVYSQLPCYVMSAYLILFSLQFSFIVNSF